MLTAVAAMCMAIVASTITALNIFNILPVQEPMGGAIILVRLLKHYARPLQPEQGQPGDQFIGGLDIVERADPYAVDKLPF